MDIPGSDIEKAETALRILCAVSRIDFDFFSPLLPDAFSAMITVGPVVCPSPLLQYLHGHRDDLDESIRVPLDVNIASHSP